MSKQNESIEGTKLILEEWKIVIQTQMHFNDMIMKMRTTGVSIVLAVFGAAAYSLQYDKLMLTICGHSFHASVLVILFGLGMLIGVFGLDYFYYYKMLLGAVKRGDEIDEAYKNRRVDNTKIFGMTTMIHEAIGKRGKSRYFIWLFYGLVFALGIIFIIGILLGYTPAFNGNS
jgi:hypothetical protein